MLINQDTGEHLCCEYCNSTDSCEHLIALYNVTDGCIESGQFNNSAEIEEILTSYFRHNLKNFVSDPSKIEPLEDSLQEIWRDIIYEYRDSADIISNKVDFYLPNYSRFIIENIENKVDHNQKYPFEKSIKEFVSGETLLYLGKNYKLYVINEDIEGVVVFDSKFFISKTNQANANKLFREWFVKSTEQIVIPKAKQISKNIGVSFNNINIVDLKMHWGLCTPKDNIHLNWRLIKAPMSVIEYINIHELTHLLEANHTPEFWNRVASQLPSYEKAKHWLKENGHELETDFY